MDSERGKDCDATGDAKSRKAGIVNGKNPVRKHLELETLNILWQQ